MRKVKFTIDKSEIDKDLLMIASKFRPDVYQKNRLLTILLRADPEVIEFLENKKYVYMEIEEK